MDLNLRELINPAHSAILAIDMQNDACHPEGLFAKIGLDTSLRREAAHNAAAFIDKARKFNLPIIIIKLTHSGWNDRQPGFGAARYEVPRTEAYKEGTWARNCMQFSPKRKITL